MPDVQTVNEITNIDILRYVFAIAGVFFAVVNSLIVYIFIDLKNWVKKIDKKVDDHHDKIIKLETKNEG